MRSLLTRERLQAFMRELARCAPRRGGPFSVHFVGGASAVYAGWRDSSIDVDLHSDDEVLFRDIQAIKERLQINVEFARPEHFVPALEGADTRHRLIERIGAIDFHHYDPYSQLLSKIARGFERDLDDARHIVRAGWVDPDRFRRLVEAIPDAAYARYPRLTPRAVRAAVEAFARDIDRAES